MKRRRKKFVEALSSDPTTANRKHRQNHQRYEHDLRALMNTAVAMLMRRGRPCPRAADHLQMIVAVACLRFTAELSKKGQEPEPEHIKGRQESGEDADCPENPASIGARECLPQNRILAEEARERRKSRDRESRRCHRPKSPRDIVPETAHLAHVLLAADSMDDRACR